MYEIQLNECTIRNDKQMPTWFFAVIHRYLVTIDTSNAGQRRADARKIGLSAVAG